MERRDIAFGLLAASSAVIVSQRAEAQSCTAPCYTQTAAERAAGVTPSNTSYPPGNVLRYGAVGDGVTNSSTAFANAVAQATQTGGAAVYVPGGQFVTAIVLSGTVTNLRIYGDDPLTSVLIAVSTTSDVIALASSAFYWGLTLENLSLLGSLSGPTGSAGNGIHIPSGASGFGMRFANLLLGNFGNSGILDQAGIFSTVVENVRVNFCNGHGIDMRGGPGLSFINCYAMSITSNTGKAGFRIHAANPVFVGCNGVNSGDYWGIFSDSPADDGDNLICSPTLINCNVESFGVAGVRNKNAYFVLINTMFVANSGGTVKAIVHDAQPTHAGLNFMSGFVASPGTAWANGQPVHCHSAPYIQVGNPGPNSNDSAPYTFYDDQLGMSFIGPTVGFAYTAYGLYGTAHSSLATNESNILLHALASLASGAGTSAGTLTNAPVAGNPTKWIPIDDAGTTRYIPAW